MPTLLVLREHAPGETRVAATPDTVRRMVKAGHRILVERGAGLGAQSADDAFVDAGAEIVDGPSGTRADILLAVNPPEDLESLDSGALLVSFLWPAADPARVRRIAGRGLSCFAMDQVPRITRAQRMDALSSQSNIAGYKAVLLGANHLPKIFPLLMTAAGTIRPAKVVVMGAGVAGLQAIATARRLGAVVEVSDVRAAVKEQVESLGASFIELDDSETLEGDGGYAKEASKEFLARQQAKVRTHVVAADVVITTALVPGRRAPVLVTADMVAEMRSGSVIVDLAVEQGGNCELSVPGDVVTREGVTIVGHRNVPALVPCHASEVYSRNVLAVVDLLCGESGVEIDLADDIQVGAMAVHAGEIRCDLPGGPRDEGD